MLISEGRNTTRNVGQIKDAVVYVLHVDDKWLIREQRSLINERWRDKELRGETRGGMCIKRSREGIGNYIYTRAYGRTETDGASIAVRRPTEVET